MTNTITCASRRDTRQMSRACHAVTHADVTPCVTVPPTRPDPTRNYYTGHLDHQTKRYVPRDPRIGLATP